MFNEFAYDAFFPYAHLFYFKDLNDLMIYIYCFLYVALFDLKFQTDWFGSYYGPTVEKRYAHLSILIVAKCELKVHLTLAIIVC